MGLGKTPIAIASAEELFAQQLINCCLVVCPASLKYQWAEKIAFFTDLPKTEKKVGKETIIVPGEHCVVIDGDKENRKVLYASASTVNNLARYVIISYDSVLSDFAEIKKLAPNMVVLDEATAIKSFKAKRSKRIKRGLKPEYRLALTGTPIENRPDELFSIMQWVDEEVLGRYDLFERAYIERNKYGWVVSYKNLNVLNQRVAPAIARLTDKDPETQGFMPKVDEDNWHVQLDDKTLHLYKHIATDMLTELENISPYADFNLTDYYTGADESKPSGKLMAMYTALEMLVDHPDLIIWSGIQYEHGDNRKGSRYAYELWQSGALDELIHSPKLEELYRRVQQVDSEKVLIFTKFRHMLDILQLYLTDSVQFHGGLSPVKKAEVAARYRNDNKCRFFLSSDAGAYGMDMNMSNLLINYDLPWSSGAQAQRNYRHIRRSSAFAEVQIRNLITVGSFEERRVRILGRKRRVASTILDRQGQNDSGRVEIDGDSLRMHLEHVLDSGPLIRYNSNYIGG